MEHKGQLWDAVEVVRGVQRLEKEEGDRNEGLKHASSSVPFRRSRPGSRSELDSLKVRVLTLSLSLVSSKREKLLERYVFSKLKSTFRPEQDLYGEIHIWSVICAMRNRVLSSVFQTIRESPQVLNKEQRKKKPTVLTSLAHYETIQHFGDVLISALAISKAIGLESIKKRSAGINVLRTLHLIIDAREKGEKRAGFQSVKLRYGADSMKSVLESVLRSRLSGIIPVCQSMISTMSLISVLSTIHLSHQSKTFFKIRTFNLSSMKLKPRKMTYSFTERPLSSAPFQRALLTTIFHNINHTRVRSGMTNEHCSLALIRVLSGIRYRILETSLMRLRCNAPKGKHGLNFLGTIMKVGTTVLQYNIQTSFYLWTKRTRETRYQRILEQLRLHSAGKTLFKTAANSLKSIFLRVWREETNRLILRKRQSSAAYFLFNKLNRILSNRKADLFSVLKTASLRPDLLKKSFGRVFALLKPRVFRRFMLGFYPMKSWAKRKSQIDSTLTSISRLIEMKTQVRIQRVFEGMKCADLDRSGNHSPGMRSILHLSLPCVLTRVLRRRTKNAFSNILAKAKTVQKSILTATHLSTYRYSLAHANANFQHKVSIAFNRAKAWGTEVIQTFFSRWKTAIKRNSARIALVQEFYSLLAFKFVIALKRTRFLVWNKIRQSDFRLFLKGTKKPVSRKKVTFNSIEKQKGKIQVRNYSLPIYQKLVESLKRVQTGIKKKGFVNLRIIFFKEKRAKATYRLLNHLLIGTKTHAIERLRQFSSHSSYLQTLFMRLSAQLKAREFKRNTTLKRSGFLHWWEITNFLKERENRRTKKAIKSLISTIEKIWNQRRSEVLLAISKTRPLTVSKKLAALKIVSMIRYKDKLRLRESVL